MEKRRPDHQKVLQDLDRMLAEAPDEASRDEIRRLRDSLNAPQMLDMARAAREQRFAAHQHIRCSNFTTRCCPSLVTATGGVIAAAICLYAVVLGFEAPTVVDRPAARSTCGSSRRSPARCRSLSPRCR